MKIVLLLCGDVPLLQTTTLQALLDHHRQTGAAVTVLTAEMADPTGYGRIIRDTAGVAKIVPVNPEATSRGSHPQ